MPRKSKHAKFRGKQKQFLPQRRRSDSIVAIEARDKSTGTASTPVSQKKLERNSSLLQEDFIVDDGPQIATGYCLIDLDCLVETMSNLHMCEDGKC